MGAEREFKSPTKLADPSILSTGVSLSADKKLKTSRGNVAAQENLFQDGEATATNNSREKKHLKSCGRKRGEKSEGQ